MQRKIKFRGKNKDIGWVYGQLAYDINGNTYIIQEVELDSSYGLEETMLFATMWYRVDKETIGQYTGLKDKNGKEIYEGDIIFDSFYERKAKVVFLEGAFWLDYIDDFKEYETIHKRYQLLANYDNKSVLEVIGNIYDNPELLKEGE